MSRLDSHIQVVQRRMFVGRFITAFAWALTGALLLIVLWIVAERMFAFALPHPMRWMTGLLAASAIAAFASVWSRRPTVRQAAAAIDSELNTKDAFATTLYCRSNTDPFAVAVKQEGEALAENVSMNGRFRARYPRIANAALGLAGVAICSVWWLPQVDLLGRGQARKAAERTQIKLEQDKKLAAAADPVVEAIRRAPVSAEALKPAQEAAELLKHAGGDTTKTRMQVVSHLQDVEESLKRSAETETRFRQAEKDEELLKGLETAKDAQTPLGNMQNDLKNQKFDKAAEELAAAAKTFSSMDQKQQDQAIKEAQTLSAALAKAAGNPAIQQQINNTLQQLANNPKMAQEMAKAMASAAQGNPQAAAKLAQIAKQVQQQMNNGQGPTPQQQRAMQQMLAQAQASANSQAQAQAMAQAAQSLAKAMGDAQQQQKGQGKGSAPQQTADGNKPGGTAPPQAGQQPGQAQQPGQSKQPGQMAGSGSPGDKPGDATGGNGGMAQAQQNLQQQIQQMQNAQSDSQSLAEAQNAAKEAMDQAMQEGGGQDSTPEKNQPGDNPGQGQGGGGGQQPGGGNGQAMNAGGQGQGQVNGGKRGVSAIPITSFSAMDPTQDQEKGAMLPSRYVKAGIDAGKANAEAKSVAASAQQEDAEDIEQDRIPKEAQKAVREYFTDLQQQ